jgi:hypothetical protein
VACLDGSRVDSVRIAATHFTKAFTGNNRRRPLVTQLHPAGGQCPNRIVASRGNGRGGFLAPVAWAVGGQASDTVTVTVTPFAELVLHTAQWLGALAGTS